MVGAVAGALIGGSVGEHTNSAKSAADKNLKYYNPNDHLGYDIELANDIANAKRKINSIKLKKIVIPASHDIILNWSGKGAGQGALSEIAGFINAILGISEIVVEEDKPTTKSDQYQYNTGILTGQIMIDFASVIVPYGIGEYANEIRASQEIVTVTGSAADAVAELSNEELISSALEKQGKANSAVGRAFQKHSVREVSAFTGEITGNPAKNTQQGLDYINKILGDSNATRTVRNTKAYGDVIDIRLPDGMGARWSADGKTFIGFLERYSNK